MPLGWSPHGPYGIWWPSPRVYHSLLPSHRGLCCLCRCSGTWRRACSAGRYVPIVLARSQSTSAWLTLLPEDSRLLVPLSIVWSDPGLGGNGAACGLGCLIQSSHFCLSSCPRHSSLASQNVLELFFHLSQTLRRTEVWVASSSS